MNPFNFLNEINYGKTDIMIDDIAEKQYNSFLINRGLSYFKDTVIMANEMNINHHIDNRLQFDFLINIVRRKKRFSKWNKPETVNDLDVIKEYYGYSNKQAKAVHNLLSSDKIGELRKKVYKGGKK
jgi:methyltransferase-like protein|tara:strand:- start:31938 stop:32315 length:378 start_codon:yes stop_codon:yes gene_type:complete